MFGLDGLLVSFTPRLRNLFLYIIKEYVIIRDIIMMRRRNIGNRGNYSYYLYKYKGWNGLHTDLRLPD